MYFKLMQKIVAIITEYNKLARKFNRNELIYSDSTEIDDLPF